MSRIFMDGFESGGLDLWDTKLGVIESALAGKTGAYCVKVTTGYNPLAKSITAIPYIYAAFKYYQNIVTANASVISFWGGGEKLGLLTVLYNTGILTLSWTNMTNVIVSSEVPIPTATWMLMEVYYLPHLTAGTFTVKINGVVFVTATGVKTAPSTTNIDGIQLDCTNSVNTYFDDFILDDANWIGSSSIQKSAVTAAGATTGLTPSAGSNYDCVEEIPPSDVDYIYTNTPNAVDTYVCGNLTGTINSVKAVQVQARCMQEGVSAVPKIQLVTRPASTDRVSASKDVTTFMPKTVFNIWNTNPEDSQPWEAADVNGMEIGVKAVAS